MKPSSARSLLVLSGLAVLLGLSGMSPAGAFAAVALAAVCALPPLLFAAGRLRTAAALLLLAAVSLFIQQYPDFTEHMASYRRQAESAP